MAVDIYLQPAVGLPIAGSGSEYVCSLSEACYWFLHPLFGQLAAETGQSIDLYGKALFGGPALEALARTLRTARDLVESQPERWEVTTGEMIAPVRQEIRATVSKAEIRQVLDQLNVAAMRAQQGGIHLTFFGD